MKRLVAILALLVLLLCGCGDGGRPSVESAYAEGYRKGASDVVKDIEQRAESAKNGLRKAVGPKLLWGAVAAVLMTLFDDKTAETLRRRVAEVFKLEPYQQAKLAMLAFCACAAGAIVVLWSRHSFTPIPAAMILLGTAAWHLYQGYSQATSPSAA